MIHGVSSSKGQARDLPAWMCGKGSGSISEGFGAKGGLLQEELADLTEIHQTYLGGVKRGKRNPTVTVLQRIAQALGADIEDLVERRT